MTAKPDPFPNELFDLCLALNRVYLLAHPVVPVYATVQEPDDAPTHDEAEAIADAKEDDDV